MDAIEIFKMPEIRAKRVIICCVENCKKETRSGVADMCNAHYRLQLRHGRTDTIRKQQKGLICSVDGCENECRSSGLCMLHYRTIKQHGRTELKYQKNVGKKCSVLDCPSEAIHLGLCRNHYDRQRVYGRLEKKQYHKAKHPLYRIWNRCKVKNLLCAEWLNFDTFIADVDKERPSTYHYFRRINEENLYSKDNYEWVESVHRCEDETWHEWNKRKTRVNSKKCAEIVRDSKLKRTFGISRDDYFEMLEKQNGLCAICNCGETTRHHVSGQIKSLSIDHNHKTGKVRKLLCWNCNTVIGKVGESTELLQSMIDYINKHKEIVNGTA